MRNPEKTCLLIALLAFAPSAAIAAPDCGADKVAEILDHTVRDPGDEWSHRAELDCNLTLRRGDVVTKTLILRGAAASGVTVSCNGAAIDGGAGRFNFRKDMIVIRSSSNGGNWSPPRDIAIRDCRITGSIRVMGLGRNGQAEAVRDSSKKRGHVEFARNSAPANILFERITLTGVGRTPFYLAPGVTDTRLIDSEINGDSDAAAIYLDAESARNTIKGNVLRARIKDGSKLGFYDRGWPHIGIDASSHNTIMNNIFSNMTNGGIYLYRNCGEGGTIRHSTSSDNTIVNNIFHYSRRMGDDPAVYVGSRDYGRLEKIGSCNDDEYPGFLSLPTKPHADAPYGSAASNADHARRNVIMQNQFYRTTITVRRNPRGRDNPNAPAGPIDTRPGPNPHPATTNTRNATLKDMIRSKNWKNNSPNFIDRNELVTDATVDRERLAGCYLPDASTHFIEHGQSLELMTDTGDTACYSNFTCNDGDSTRASVRDCRITKVALDCRIEGSNSGCHKVVRCPAGRKVVGAKAACNLESGAVMGSVVAALPFNRLEVVRPSDKVSQGECYVSFDRLRSGSRTLATVKNFPGLEIGCTEHDENGGDCHISGIAYCR